MDLRTYRFSSTFTLGASRKPVHDVLVDLEFYADWWPQVRAVAKIDDDHALVVCRSTLPYDLELELTALRRDLDVLEVGIDGPIRGGHAFDCTSRAPARPRCASSRRCVPRPRCSWSRRTSRDRCWCGTTTG